MTEIDLEFVRAQFPAFSENSLRDHAFFENAGASYTCRHVIWRLHRFYKERKVQPYAPYAAAQAGGAEMDEARSRLARVLGVDADELVFGPSTPANTYVLSQAFRRWLKRGDAIIVSEQDHEANSAAWRRLGTEGIEIREWKINPQTGSLHTDELKRLLDERVRLVCFPHCSNLVGEINPVAEILAIVDRAGAHSCVDGDGYAPHGLPNVGKLGADIYLFSGHRAYGPHQGIMTVRRSLAQMLPSQGVAEHDTALWKRFTPAGQDHAQVAACAGLPDYIDAVYARHYKAGRDVAARAATVHDLFRAQETRLLQPLLEYLQGRRDVRVLGPKGTGGRAPTLALELARPGVEVAGELAGHGIMAGGGAFNAARQLTAMGVDPAKGVLRLSFVHYTSRADINRLILALDQVL